MRGGKIRPLRAGAIVTDGDTYTRARLEILNHFLSFPTIRNRDWELHVDGKEIIVFPDGRAIISNTVDESLAIELYARYVGDPK